MVVAEGEAAGDPRPIDRAEVPGDALPDRLERLPAVGPGGCMDADELARAEIDRDEDIGAAARPSAVVKVSVMSVPQT